MSPEPDPPVLLADFDYELPPELIAQEPLPERDASRLLVLERRTGAVHHRQVRDLVHILQSGDLLVVNRSRVIPARLLGQRAGGGEAELLLIRPLGDDLWEALVRPGRRLREGDSVTVDEDLRATIESAGVGKEGRRRVRLSGRPSAAEALRRAGRPPLPPYIRRPAEAEDSERYQTIYAREEGSVAAPTAGLHFSSELIDRLQQAGVGMAEIVLHVGPGTFRPIRVSDVREHRLEPESFHVPPEAARQVRRTRAGGGRVVAVGTTTVRALESAAARGEVQAVSGETDMVIVPGHRFRVVDALLTNFHLPRSSLLLLVAALGGRHRVLEAYAEAVRERYRFYSYGDAMLIQ